MPMGIVSDEEFDSEVSNTIREESNSPNSSNATIIDITKGRGIGNVGVPNGLRNIIGEESTINGRESAIELAKQFGISSSSVSAYTTGAKSTASYDDKPNLAHINEAKERISKKARGKMLLALNRITGEKLDGAKVRDLAGVAKDMSAIIKNLEPDNPEGNNRNTSPTFVFYAPQIVKEDKFETIVVNE